MQSVTAPTPRLPSFAEAVETFVGFLAHEGAPTELLWLEREDVTTCRQRIWVRPGDPGAAARRAEGYYQAGRTKGLGVALEAICRIGDCAGCYVWVPEDENAASYAMQPRSLTCKLAVPLRSATAVWSALYWRLRRAINRRRELGDLFVRALPSRASPAGTCVVCRSHAPSRLFFP